MSQLGKVYDASVGATGMPLRVFVSLGLVTLLLVTLLVACGDSGTPTATSAALATATKTSAAPSSAAAAASSAPPAAPSAAPSASPLLPLPSTSARPSTSPAASTAPSTSTSTGAVVSSDGSCPESHPVKAGQLGPMKTYAVSGSTSYDTMRATECFATEADAQAAGYRKSGR